MNDEDETIDWRPSGQLTGWEDVIFELEDDVAEEWPWASEPANR